MKKDTLKNNSSNTRVKINNYKFKLKPTLFDAIILGVSLFVSIGLIIGTNVYINNLNKNNEDRIAVVYYTNTEIYRLNIDELGSEVSKTFYASEYEKMSSDIETIFSKEKGVAIVSSGCHNKICVHQGYITKIGQSSVCLPNNFYITLISDSSSPDAIIGGVTYE